MNQRLVGAHFPYILITVDVGAGPIAFEAMLDTGFEGAIIVPSAFARNAGTPKGYGVFTLADGSQTAGPAFTADVAVGPLGTFRVEIVALGNECLLGLRVANRFKITLDHGREIVVEP